LDEELQLEELPLEQLPLEELPLEELQYCSAAAAFATSLSPTF
jgi:hypothetical protein